MANPYRHHFLRAAVLTLGITLALWWFLSGQWDWPVWLGCWLAAVNVTAFGYYGYDKSRAGVGKSRVPESVLHALAAAGGSPGAYVAMNVFRHKTIKGKFRILFWCIVALQAAVAGWIIKTVWWS